MRIVTLLSFLLAGALAVGCSDSQQTSGSQNEDEAATSLSIDTEDGSVTYESGDTAVSVDDGGNDKTHKGD